MPTFDMSFTTTTSTTVKIEAETLEEAIQEAYKEGFPGLCSQCSGYGQGHNLELGDDWEIDNRSVDQDGDPVPSSEVDEAS